MQKKTDQHNTGKWEGYNFEHVMDQAIIALCGAVAKALTDCNGKFNLVGFLVVNWHGRNFNTNLSRHQKSQCSCCRHRDAHSNQHICCTVQICTHTHAMYTSCCTTVVPELGTCPSQALLCVTHVIHEPGILKNDLRETNIFSENHF